ncbi:hypothetical protein M3J07_002161 [Ascochyta lentis]
MKEEKPLWAEMGTPQTTIGKAWLLCAETSAEGGVFMQTPSDQQGVTINGLSLQ